MGVKRWAGSIAIAVCVLAVVGCTASTGGPAKEIPHDAPSGGQTLAEARQAIDDLPGIAVTELRSAPPNIKNNTGYAVSIEVEPGHRIADGPGLVDFIVRSVWSVREGYMPNTSIDISVQSPQTPFDMAAAADHGGWGVSSRLGPKTFTIAAIPLTETQETGAKNRARLGTWPGQPPTPANGITTVEPGATS